jgi:hypothetical protein
MASANIENLLSIATNLVKKKLAIKESTPVIFEVLQNIDDQIRYAINIVVASGEEEELTNEQIYLVNNALSGTRASLINFESTYAPDDTDIIGELRDVKSINFNQLEKVLAEDKELYDRLVKTGVYIPTKV